MHTGLDYLTHLHSFRISIFLNCSQKGALPLGLRCGRLVGGEDGILDRAGGTGELGGRAGLHKTQQYVRKFPLLKLSYTRRGRDACISRRGPGVTGANVQGPLGAGGRLRAALEWARLWEPPTMKPRCLVL